MITTEVMMPISLLILEDEDEPVSAIRKEISERRVPIEVEHFRDLSSFSRRLDLSEPGNLDHAKPQLIVLDLHVSTQEDGIEALKLVKSHERYDLVPRVLYSSYLDDDILLKASQNGVSSCVWKSEDGAIPEIIRYFLSTDARSKIPEDA